MTPNGADPYPGRSSDGVDVFAAAPDGIVVVDEFGTITTVNDVVREMFGYEPAELIGRPVEILLPERFRAPHVQHRTDYALQPERRLMGRTPTLCGRHKSGDEFPVDVSLNYQRDTTGRLRVVAFVRDATVRRRMEEEIRAGEESFRLLVDGVGDHAIFMLDPSGHVVTWNLGAQRIKGWSSEEILGQHLSVFYPPEDIASGLPERDLGARSRMDAPRARGGAFARADSGSGRRPRCRRSGTTRAPCAASRR